MCLILFSYRQHPRYPLIFMSNRDEFYGRPTAAADFWEDAPDLLAGRDLQAGGTWCGITRQGRFATLSNYRGADGHNPDAPSRGHLVTDYLQGDETPRAYLERLVPAAQQYNGFNLLAGDVQSLCYFSNREGAVRMLAPGLYGLSNALLDTPWPKVVRGKQALGEAVRAEHVDPEALLELLTDETKAPDAELPQTGVGQQWEHLLSSMFISSEEYGTRASTVVLIDRQGQVIFVERTYPPAGKAPTTKQHVFKIEPYEIREADLREQAR